MLPLLDLVRLTTDRYADRGVDKGAIGTIVLLHDGAYEVEFSRTDGTTIAWFTVSEEDLLLLQGAPDAENVPRAG
jgi:hypothetical protein